ncbi:unnamed protein product [Schistosoma haematobium]|nr:unnamed protein product [Schistosoma haematobium]
MTDNDHVYTLNNIEFSATILLVYSRINTIRSLLLLLLLLLLVPTINQQKAKSYEEFKIQNKILKRFY